MEIDPDWLGDLENLVEEEKRDIDGIFDFLAQYVRRVHSNDFIQKGLRGNPGTTFLDFIEPNNIWKCGIRTLEGVNWSQK